MSHEVVLTFTGQGVERMAMYGGSGHWTAAPYSLNKASYLICVRNRRRDYEDWAEKDLPHGQAFLLAKVTGVSKSPRQSSTQKQRHIVNFEEYTEINVPDAWRKCTKGQIFPVAYRSREAIETALGIDFDDPSFVWKRLSDLKPAQEEGPDEAAEEDLTSRPITVEQAKQELAAHFGVSTEQIEIHVNF
ncbi:hypothetical protein [Modicisalibacter sp. 'Wilcox']|uniref:hypothetical protein n=1 Tax=Modicisalibacter sp. 'Wilcox' TaxID=2679914 RepID=UPI0013D05E7C|nr:hypothetical protein [Modicisalibacter sp. 'Wilcox']